jgi:integrase
MTSSSRGHDGLRLSCVRRISSATAELQQRARTTWRNAPRRAHFTSLKPLPQLRRMSYLCMKPAWPLRGSQSPMSAAFLCLAEFLAEAQARGLSARTRGEYERLIGRFLRQSPTVAAGDVHRFVFGPGPSGRPPAPATAALRRAALSSCFDFACRQGRISRNPARDLPRPRRRPSAPRGLSHDEIGVLLSAIPDTASGVRDGPSPSPRSSGFSGPWDALGLADWLLPRASPRR